jgi:hypothetical protein
MTGLLVTLRAAPLPDQEPAKKTETIKPPAQRTLQGEDAQQAAEQEKKLAQLQEAGRLTEAFTVDPGAQSCIRGVDLVGRGRGSGLCPGRPDPSAVTPARPWPRFMRL